MKKALVILSLLLLSFGCDKTDTPDAGDASTDVSTDGSKEVSTDAGPTCEEHLAKVESDLTDAQDTLNGCMTSMPKRETFEITKDEQELPCGHDLSISIHKLDSKALYLGYRTSPKEREFSGRMDIRKHADRRALYLAESQTLINVISCGKDKCKVSCVGLSGVDED
jgi:hypothetical protein